MFNQRRLTWLRQGAIPIGIFVLALVVRVSDLGGYLTSDEANWVYLSRWFAGGVFVSEFDCPSVHRQGLACTLQEPHPGVTTMWSGGLGILAHYWQAKPSPDLSSYLRPQGDPPQRLPSTPIDPALIAPTRFPLALSAALFLPLFYLLVQNLMDERVALIAALLLALTPFHIALTRILHHDGITTTSMILAILAMMGYWLKDRPWYWLVFSGVMAGIGFLSKPVSWYLIPYIGLLALWRFWHRREMGYLIKTGFLWLGIASLTFTLFFPAMWVQPLETLQTIFRSSSDLAQAGHKRYFLGQLTQNPGWLFYPLNWLSRATPLEVIGLFLLLIGVLAAAWGQPSTYFHTLIQKRPLEILWLIFLITFLIFESIPAKKIIFYFLPAFPVISIFAAVGLLWLLDKLTHRPEGLAFLSGVVLMGQGWYAFNHHPYYFTYYNPLLGGPKKATELVIVGKGEGMDRAADYLNHLPEAESLQVASCSWYARMFAPFFVGQVPERSCTQVGLTEADYILLYQAQLQLQEDMKVGSYLQEHYEPVYRVQMHGVDFVTLYQNPMRHQLHILDNSLPEVMTMYGYNLTKAGQLTLFWKNEGLIAKQSLMVGLAPPRGGETEWIGCHPASGFAEAMYRPGAIVETICSLDQASSPADIYDLHLALADESGLHPIPSSGLILISITANGDFQRLTLTDALELIKEEALPPEIHPLELTFNDRFRLLGYQLDPPVWHPDSSGTITLYWQPIRRIDFGLANAFRIVLQLTPENLSEPMLTATHPILSPSSVMQEVARGAIVPIHYSLPLPAEIAPGNYLLNVCLGTKEMSERASDTTSAQWIDCLPLPVQIDKTS